ncbi:MAG TPA: EAL domain-containing protein, partial [Pyrinomonadaceae bacterium]|nr:EAL domain-containing protein [Pyrinomonadaceae bacterium]
RKLLCDLLGLEHRCIAAASGEEAVEMLAAYKPSVVVSDINLPGMGGLDLLRLVREISPDTVVVMVTGNRTIEHAIEAIREGAFDFITKPFDLDHVELAIRRASDHHDLLVAKRQYEENLEQLVRARTGRLEYLAYHDELTGLPNRTLLEDHLARVLVDVRPGEYVASLILVPDRFRDIRDTLGHASGDWLLKEFAGRLSAAFNIDSVVARLEGHEFAVVVSSLHGRDGVVRLMSSLAQALASPFTVGGRRIFLSASAGISLFPDDGGDSHTLLRNAGAALSHARRVGATYEFFDQRIRQASMRRLNIESELRHAIRKEQLELHYQPKIGNRSGTISGAEALLRWSHPSGEIGPNEFIPIAEETGTIVELGQWVLDKACSQVRKWCDAGHEVSVAVNVSAAQFDADLASTVKRAIADSGIRPQLLDIEVTESSVMRNAEHAAGLLRELKETGIKVSIDDFGTGYSSLGHLKRLPIDVLKIDRSFIADVPTSQSDASLVMGIIGLAHSLNLCTVAEGVETEAQLRFLDLIKCDEWQGFLASKAVPPADFERLLTSGCEFKL